MENIKEYTKDQLLEYIEKLEKTIKVQHDTINRLLDAYVLNSKSDTNE